MSKEQTIYCPNCGSENIEIKDITIEEKLLKETKKRISIDEYIERQTTYTDLAPSRKYRITCKSCGYEKEYVTWW